MQRISIDKGISLSGGVASQGYAEGQLFELDQPLAGSRASGSPDIERATLENAIATAASQIARLIAEMEGDAAAILEFQLAMIEDEALTRPAFTAIAAGAPSDFAWADALNAEIAGYETSDQYYFRARAADIRDIRDRVLRALTADAGAAVPAGAILIGDDIAPTRFLETDWNHGGGIALSKGSAASHVAMLARSRGVPMVIGLGSIAFEPGAKALLDAEHGVLVLEPSEAEISAFRRASQALAASRVRARDFLAKPALMRSGQPVSLKINITDPADIDGVDISTCDGVGLMRTEFLFGEELPDEERQYRAYRKVLEWAGGKPVTIRTVDAGGDKPVPGFTVEENNPFLGLRGIRLSLARPDIFRIQIRALLRAAVHGDLKVMFPMIAVPEEYSRAVALFSEEVNALTETGLAHKMPPLGIMVEVPSVAIAPEEFANVAFFSIGSNDLTQYVMAAARDNGAVAALNSVRHPPVFKLIRQVIAFGIAHAIPVSLCGDAGGDPAAIPALLEAGLRDLSVAPAQLAVTKAAIADVII